MKGTIEALKLQTDRKKQRYAVATINGEDIYTWDGAMIESLRSVGEGALAKYELAEKGDFKFQKFESLTVVKGDGEQAGPRRAGWPDERIRYLGPTEIKSRTEMVKLAGMQLDTSKMGLGEIGDKTLELAEKYMRFVVRGYEDQLEAIRPLKDAD